jgi:hypothetical protein
MPLPSLRAFVAYERVKSTLTHFCNILYFLFFTLKVPYIFGININTFRWISFTKYHRRLRIDNKTVKHKMVNISWAGALCGRIRDICDNLDDFVLAALVSFRGQPANYSIASRRMWKTFTWRWYNTETCSEFLTRKIVTKHVSVYNWTYCNSVPWTPM